MNKRSIEQSDQVQVPEASVEATRAAGAPVPHRAGVPASSYPSSLHIPLVVQPHDRSYQPLLNSAKTAQPTRARELANLGAEIEDAVKALADQRLTASAGGQVDVDRAVERMGEQMRPLLNDAVERVISRVVEVKTEQRERSRSSLAGLPYQAQVLAALKELASPADDDVDPVGERTGVSDRKGDILVSVSKEVVRGQPDPLILFEAKHWTSDSMSQKQVRDELQRGMTNWRAKYGVLVGLPETLPKGTTPLDPIGPTMFAVAYDPEDEDWADIGRKLLGATYRLSRRALIEDARARTGEIDRAGCRRLIDYMKNDLAKVVGAIANIKQGKGKLDAYLEETNLRLDELDDKLTA